MRRKPDKRAVGQRQDEDSLGRLYPFARRELCGAAALSEQEQRDAGGWHKTATGGWRRPVFRVDRHVRRTRTPANHENAVQSGATDGEVQVSSYFPGSCLPFRRPINDTNASCAPHWATHRTHASALGAFMGLTLAGLCSILNTFKSDRACVSEPLLLRLVWGQTGTVFYFA